MDFVNLTPYTAEVLDANGETIEKVEPTGATAFAIGEEPTNVPPPEDGKVYIVLPAVTEVSDRSDLISVEPGEANRSRRGNVQSHICHWTGNGTA